MKEHMKYIRAGLTIFLSAIAVLIFYDTFHHFQGSTIQRFFAKLFSALAPVLYGFAMAYLLLPVLNWFERLIRKGLLHIKSVTDDSLRRRRGWVRAGAILLTWAVALLLVYLLMSVLIPQLTESVTMLIKNARSYYYTIYKWVDTWLANNPEIGSWANEVLEGYYTDAVSLLTNKVLPWAQQMAANLTGGIWSGIWSIVTVAKNLIVGIIVSVYLMIMKEKSLARCYKLLYATMSEKGARLVAGGVRKMNTIFSGFVRGKLLDSLIIGILCFIAGSILKLPYTPLVSVVVGITNIIPFFGPFLGAIPSALLILLVDPKKCLVFIIMVVVLQQFDGNILGPKILGDSTGISSFWVVVAILVGGGFAGVPGMFLGVPVCACLQELLKYLMNKRLRERGMPTEACAYVHRDLEIPADEDHIPE